MIVNWIPYETVCDFLRCHLDWVIWGICLYVCPHQFRPSYTFSAAMCVCVCVCSYMDHVKKIFLICATTWNNYDQVMTDPIYGYNLDQGASYSRIHNVMVISSCTQYFIVMVLTGDI